MYIIEITFFSHVIYLIFACLDIFIQYLCFTQSYFQIKKINKLLYVKVYYCKNKSITFDININTVREICYRKLSSVKLPFLDKNVLA